MSSKVAAPGLFDRAIIRRASVDAFRKLDPRQLARNPVIFVTEVVSVVVTLIFLRDLVAQNGTASVHGADRGLAVVHRAFRQFRRSRRRRARQGAGRCAAQDPHRHARQSGSIDPEGKSGHEGRRRGRFSARS